MALKSSNGYFNTASALVIFILHVVVCDLIKYAYKSLVDFIFAHEIVFGKSFVTPS
jgi:hypothetical protein